MTGQNSPVRYRDGDMPLAGTRRLAGFGTTTQ